MWRNWQKNHRYTVFVFVDEVGREAVYQGRKTFKFEAPLQLGATFSISSEQFLGYSVRVEVIGLHYEEGIGYSAAVKPISEKGYRCFTKYVSYGDLWRRYEKESCPASCPPILERV